ncbi:polyprenyl synthetase family protein [bacterium]|nr:polyprenyl synthetase family protein [bacterium]
MHERQSEFTKIIQPVLPLMDEFHDAFQREFELILASHPEIRSLFPYPRGKRLRPLLFFLCQGLFQKPRKESLPVALMIELVHTASLIHDDVIDESHLRRGEHTINAVLGNHFSVLVGDYLIARMMMLGLEQHNGVMGHLSGAILQMTQAELMQAVYEKQRSLDETTYFSIIEGKTGALFREAAWLGGDAASASAPEAVHLEQFGLRFGLAFQIQDDIMDFTGSPDKLGKPVHQDIHRGLWTLPVIHAYNDLSGYEKKEFQKGLEKNVILEQILLQAGHARQGVMKANAVLKSYSDEALQFLTGFPESEYRLALEKLIRYNLERRS